MKLNRRHLLTGSATTIAGIAAYSFSGSLLGDVSIVTPARAEDLSTLNDPGPMGEKILGDENADVTIIEYASMTCGHCGSFHVNTMPGIKEKYIDTGKAKLYFREFPGDPRAAAAFMLARCAPEDRYFALIDLMFKQQATWVQSANVVDELFKISKLAGFTQEAFNACLKNQELLDNVLAVKNKAIEDYGVGSTPTFFIKAQNMKAICQSARCRKSSTRSFEERFETVFYCLAPASPFEQLVDPVWASDFVTGAAK